MRFTQKIESEMQFGTRRLTLLKNSGLFETYRDSEESAKGDIQKSEEQRTIAIQTTNESTPSREWSFKPIIFTTKQDIRTWWNRFRLFVEINRVNGADLRNCLATFLDDDCLSRLEFRVPEGPTDIAFNEKKEEVLVLDKYIESFIKQ
ncbi:hypothetical protein BpHYR1_014452 [Brachionus plicatilis]|uniref:Uncharacterized protein n=1 Tax=Brachionus plicatilis TaxID=10195 RepID=A0A3M7RNI8_BRAPC|nr:hypothetical protein BpHYR1_014452 [Brachionus plicatilis]